MDGQEDQDFSKLPLDERLAHKVRLPVAVLYPLFYILFFRLSVSPFLHYSSGRYTLFHCLLSLSLFLCLCNSQCVSSARALNS